METAFPVVAGASSAAVASAANAHIVSSSDDGGGRCWRSFFDQTRKPFSGVVHYCSSEKFESHTFHLFHALELEVVLVSIFRNSKNRTGTEGE